ncbi:MAG TPA: TldD/PmbA family protein [Thermoleophilia bacterium]|nr:TldD/PmbA family protein [Thermoleophilia bacterium]
MDIASFDAGLLRATIARALSRGGDFAEVFVEDRESLGLRLEDGRIEQTSGGREVGAAVRLLSGERTYYAYSDAVDEAGLTAAADAVAAAVSAGARGPEIVDLGAVRADPGKHPVLTPPDDVAIARKAALVRTGDEAARAASAEIVQAIVGYGDTRQRVLIANSLGDLVFDDRTRTRFTTQVVARRDEIIQTGHETVGGSAGFELVDEEIARRVAQAAAEKARVMLDSKPAPVGAMPVVLANGFGGTLFHEACGHGLEADAIAKGASIYEGKMGEVVAASIVSAYDDGSIANGWGSQAFDDEGVPTQKTMVIEDGRLTGYLYDRLRAREAGAPPTGNGRRQSFRHVPIPRMTTTYIAPGAATAEEIIAATPSGFYAKSLAGGQVEPASGNFVFGVAEGYLIEDGKVTTPLRGATLVGNGIDILMKIDMIAGDFDVKTGICGKDGQGVPVGTGQATLRIAEMTVGGTG